MFAAEQSAKYGKSECTIEGNILIGKILTEEKHNDFGQTVIRSFNENPDFVGMIDAETEEKVTFAAMKDRSIRCALWLRKQGITENDVIGISTDVQMSDYVPYLATLFINAVVNPWHYNATAENAQQCFHKCPPKIMFACEQSIDQLVAIAKEKGVDCKFITFKRHPQHVSMEEILAEQTPQEVNTFRCTIPSDQKKKLSVIIYSSGTTCKTPKIVMLSYHSLIVRLMNDAHATTDSTSLVYTSYAWMLQGHYTLASICQRSTRIVHRQFDVELSASLIEKYKVNILFVRPYSLVLWHRANVFSRYDFTSMNVISFGGTMIGKTILEEIRKNLPKISIRNVYGSTEAGASITVPTKNCKNIDSVGFVRSGVQLKIIDSVSGILLGPNQQGEICVKSSTNMLGYFQNEEETKKAINEDGWLRTGDLGSYDENGEIMVSGRLKAVIKTRFDTLLPNEIEDILMLHPAVKDCAVVAVDHPIDVERPFMFIVKSHGAEIMAKDLIDFAASKNKLYGLTAGLVFVDEIPYTHTGKKWLVKLQEMAKQHSRCQYD